MGAEVACEAVIDGEPAHGRALLETDEIVFRDDGVLGEARPRRLRIPLADISSVEADGDALVVSHGRGTARFILGERAAGRWVQRILHPPTLADKLDVKAGHRVSVLDMHDATGGVGLVELLEGRGADVSLRLRKDSDLIFLGVTAQRELLQLNRVEPSLARTGSVWVVYRKGRHDLSENDVLAAGRGVGLTDTKVARFSDTHTALKFVIPKDRR